MLSLPKEKKTATLIFQFIDENIPKDKNNLFKITVLERTLEINLDKTNRYSLKIEDINNNDYKIYTCTFFFQNTEKNYSISIYFGKKNYYYCGIIPLEESVEVIFSDFISKNIENSDLCYITYKNKKYYAIEDFGLKTRKRINLLNINIKDLIFPELLMKNESIDLDKLNEKNYLLSISVTNNCQKIIGIYLNNPFIYPTIPDIKEIKDILSNTLKKGNDYLNYKDEYTDYKNYLNNIKGQLIMEYDSLLRKSSEIELMVAPFFLYYKENYNNEELEVIDLYSEFLIMFPSIKNCPKAGKCINKFNYYKQYYYSKKSIYNFQKSIKDNVSYKDNILLKYCACSCLNALLFEGYGKNDEMLFTFLDFGDKNTIYNDAIQHNLNFINSLKETSEIFLFLLQINSGSSLNKINSVLTSRITMLDTKDVQRHLRETIPKYGIRLTSVAGFKAMSFCEMRITCFCEYSIFFQICKDIHNKFDDNYSFRFVLSNILKHEDFGHLTFSINNFSFQQDKIINSKRKNYENYVTSSPFEYYKTFEIKNKKNEEKSESLICIVSDDYNNEEKGESGESLMFFLTRGNEKLMNLLESIEPDFKELFENPSLMAENDLGIFIEKLEALLPDEKDSLNIIEEGNKYKLNKKHKMRALPYPREPKF